MPAIKERLEQDIVSALKAGEKKRLGALRLIKAAIQKRELDERSGLDETQIMAVLKTMVKQRTESIDQFRRAGRQDLLEQEEFERGEIRKFMPAPPSEAEMEQWIERAIADAGAESPSDMGRVLGKIAALSAGRPLDMKLASQKVGERLRTANR